MNSQMRSIPLAATPGSDVQQEELGLFDIFGMLWRGKWWIVLSTFLAVVIAAAYSIKIATPFYTSSTELALQSREEQVVDFENVISGLSSDEATLNTEIAVLRSRELISRLVQRLNFTEDAEFNPVLRERNPWAPGEIIKSAKSLVGASDADAPPPSTQEQLDLTIDEVLEVLQVRNLPNSYVFRITARTTDPVKSARMVDNLADLYILSQLEIKLQANEHATKWLTQRVSELKFELGNAETAVKEYNTNIDLVSAETLLLLNRQLKDFRDRLSTAQQTRDELSVRIADLKSAQGATPEEMARVSGDNRLIALLPVSQADRPGFDAKFAAILNRAQFDFDRASTQARTLERSTIDLAGQVEAQSADLIRLQQLEREAEASRLIYEYFLGRLKETSVQQGIQQADSRILSKAVIPPDPSHPRVALIVMMAALLGLTAGSGAVVMRGMRRNGFRTGREVEQATGVTVIGEIPSAPTKRRKKTLEYLVSKPNSAFSEAVRNLRTSLLLSNVDKPPQVIMMTSSIPGEGKTTLSMALTRNPSLMGKKVLLIEGDVRRRAFSEYFDLTGQKGILSACMEEAPLQDILYRSEDLAADILAGETSKVNAADFFSSDRLAKLIERVRKDYDLIIIDAPPVLAVPDARLIGQLADTIMYVVRWESTPKVQLQQGLHAFSTINAPINNLVLNLIDPKKMKSYGYGESYGGKYAGYYET